jgi:epoxyqueuosine reductase QueG
MDKERIRKYGLDLGADVVGFAAASDYTSERTAPLTAILPGVKSLVVLGYREIHGANESANVRAGMASRLGGMDFAQTNNYLMARYIEKKTKTKAAPVAPSYPMNMEPPTMGMIADVSLRHAALAAGLGVFGRHNLIINPEYGSQIVFTAILTELPLSSDPQVKDELCNDCGLCVDSCPGGALAEEGKTDMIKCLKSSQPYGIMRQIRFFSKFIGAAPEAQKELLRDPVLLSLYQAQFIGFQYHCFKCVAVCPACQ